MQVIKLGGKFFGFPEAIKKVSDEIGESNKKTFIVVSAVKEITRILVMLNFTNLQRGLNTEFRMKSISFYYGLFETLHLDLIDRLFEGRFKKDVIDEFYVFFNDLKHIIEESEGLDAFHNIVQRGELISSMIYHRYLNYRLFENVLINAPDFVVTSPCKSEQEEIWEIKPHLIDITNGKQNIFLTQGFIGKDNKGNPTTLGNDGSDYSAAKFAEFFHKQGKKVDLTFLKDVLGVYDSDPKKNPFAKIIPKINFNDYERISKEGYVVRPDAISTIIKNGIPTTIRSFLDLKNPGTKITR